MNEHALIDKSVHEVCTRVSDLVTLNSPFKSPQRRLRDIMDGGPQGLRALVGSRGAADLDTLDSLPAGNPILSGLTHLSQKLQAIPDLKIPPPKDTAAAREHAYKREKIIRSLDEADDLEMQMPQVGLWLPGYGFASWVVTERMDPDGFPYPHSELRDPIESYPGDWGVDQQPSDIAYLRNIPLRTLLRKYPEHAQTLLRDRRGPGGAVMLGSSGMPTANYQTGDVSDWSTQSQGIQIAEYYDEYGCWWVVPDRNLLLEFKPLPKGMSRPQFVIAKRFAFNKLQGQYDHAIGLMAMMARLQVMQAQFIQDSVHTETNIYGQAPAGGYRKGRFAINEFDPNTRVEKPINNMPPQVFQAINSLEVQLRGTVRYPITDDGRSPNSFVTGAGLEELGSTMSLEVREYQTVMRRALERKDSLRLEWLERYYGSTKRPLYGEYKGEKYAETFTPSIDIAGNYKTRRKYGFMAGWDEARKLVSGINLVQNEIIPRQIMRENLDGLDESLTRVEELIRSEKAETVAMSTLMTLASQGDPNAMLAAISMMPASPVKTALEKFFTPPEPAAPEMGMPAGAPAGPPGLEDILAQFQGGESLSRMSADGNVGGGIQSQATAA